jgi:MFS family permease
MSLSEPAEPTVFNPIFNAVILDQAAAQEDFQAELDKSDLTRPMWMLWILSAGLIALDGFDFFVIGVAMPFIQRDFALSAAWVGAIATAALVGALVGSLTLGPITDQVGRQRMLMVDIGLFVMASVGTALAWNAASLLFFRFAVGVGIGADYPISVSYITENMPARLRGRMVIGAFSFQSVGALLGALVGWGTIAAFEQIAPELAVGYAWRVMLAVGIALAVLVGGLRLLFLLESPSYYLAKGDYAAASEAASQLLGKKVRWQPPEDLEKGALAFPLEGSANAKRLNEKPSKGIAGLAELETHDSRPLGYRDLFSSAYIQQTALASIPWFLQDIATYGIGIFTPTIIAALTVADGGGLLSPEIASARGAAIVNVFLVVGFLLAIASINRIGRIPLQMTGFVGMAAGLCLLSFSESSLVWLFAGFILFNLMMNLGPNSTTFLLSGELFPSAIRASGAGLAGAVAKSGAVLGALGLPIVQAQIGVTGVVRSLAALCILAAILTYALSRFQRQPAPKNH